MTRGRAGSSGARHPLLFFQPRKGYDYRAVSMEETSRQFANRILTFHAFLLVLVLALVAAASAVMYDSTRTDALEQARTRQELLADETSRGVETFYTSLISDLGWIQRRQDVPVAALMPGAGAASPRRIEAVRDRIDTRLVAEQLGGRVSALFVFDKQSGRVVPVLPQQSKLSAAELPADMIAWLRGVNGTKVSDFMHLKGQGVSLVAASFGKGDPLLLVAVVSGQEIDRNFLHLLNDQNSAGVALVDSRLQVVSCTNHDMAGMNLSEFDNPQMRDLIQTYQQHPRTSYGLFIEPLSIGAVVLGPRMVTLTPVSITAEDHWTLVFAQPLANIDAAVKALFKRAVYWAAFVAASITAILVSTAIQMIRWRGRLERERHQVLERDLQQARRIQQQWLPDLASVPARIDMAAVNQPARHISGDFYNWFDLANGRHVVLIGDVTGHGMTAAFLMATTQLLVRNIMARVPDPGAAMEELNLQLCTQMFYGQFVTLQILTLDFEQKLMEVCSAGHPPPLILEAGRTRPLEVLPQLVLGVEKDVRYPTQQFALPDSSGLLLYTDGVVDAQGPGDERYGIGRLRQTLDHQSGSAQEIIDAVTASVRQFHGGRELNDDLTLVAIQWRKAALRPGEMGLPSAAIRANS
jgi:serine phosphatase RsbU (regulator of sigma subunit)